MRKLSINVSKIPRDKIKEGRKGGKFVDLVLFENRHGKDEFGNDGFIALDVTKEEREAGERGPIVGNWKHLGGSSSRPQGEHSKRSAPPKKRPPVDPDLDTDSDSIPF